MSLINIINTVIKSYVSNFNEIINILIKRFGYFLAKLLLNSYLGDVSTYHPFKEGKNRVRSFNKSFSSSLLDILCDVENWTKMKVLL